MIDFLTLPRKPAEERSIELDINGEKLVLLLRALDLYGQTQAIESATAFQVQFGTNGFPINGEVRLITELVARQVAIVHHSIIEPTIDMAQCFGMLCNAPHAWQQVLGVLGDFDAEPDEGNA